MATAVAVVALLSAFQPTAVAMVEEAILVAILVVVLVADHNKV